MKWSSDAESAILKVPFFVRKKVKKKVEDFVGQKGKTSVELSDVTELKKKFLSKGGMEKEIKGYEVTACFGEAGCPNTANSCAQLAKDIEAIMKKENILSFLKENVKGDLKFHHEFRIALSDCPNACSRPQIVDIGIIGSVLPGIFDEACTLCSSCVEVCDENAVTLDEEKETPLIDYGKCLLCAKCIRACPTGTIGEKEKGFRVMLGGRLGRHPRLAMEIPKIHSHDEVLEIVKKCLKFYKENSKIGQRFSHLFSSVDQIIDV
ncbi:MAG: 4Fe-4S binding protein [Deltaproteobacteria bacterium]|uniref:4Fe-4S dicluster domain-containing protein n=1 Tax=Desulfobacula sp. TaxID=2593537 RepID=UPI00198FCFA1|nr:4Fe-4S binding protein [Candidatus Desulfobacula maris]MBL6994011.1 4Fe-4S binding protein [Desulfobacula sp.]